MPLPHFASLPKMFEVVNLSLSSIVFDINVLDEQILKMDSNTITFGVNVEKDHSIEPLETIMEMIKSNKKMIVTKVINNKQGITLFKIIFNEFQFTSINNLLDFDYSKPTILELVVSYTFKDIVYINENNLITRRALKICKILNKDYEWCHLTKKELNIK